MPPTTSLRVRVVFENERRVPGAQFQLSLMDPGGTPLQQGFTNTDGQATFNGLAPGSYTLSVSGPSIENTTTTFQIQQYEGSHLEYVRVKPLRSGATGSTAASVSTAALMVPEKALKEFTRGYEAANHGELQKAQEHYRKAAGIYPGYAAAQSSLGVVCLKLKDWACAREALERAVQIDPHSGHALLNLARLRLAENNAAQAEPLLQRALAVEPTNADTLSLMAHTEVLLHKYPDAVHYARKVHAIPHSGLAVAHLIAAQALEAQGRQQEAVLELTTFLHEAPQHPLAPQVRAALARLDQNAHRSAQQ